MVEPATQASIQKQQDNSIIFSWWSGLDGEKVSLLSLFVFFICFLVFVIYYFYLIFDMCGYSSMLELRH